MHSRSEEKIRERNELYSLSCSGLAQPEEPIWIYFLISWMYKIRTCCECVAESLQLDVQGNLTRALKQDLQNVSWVFERPISVSWYRACFICSDSLAKNLIKMADRFRHEILNKEVLELLLTFGNIRCPFVNTFNTVFDPPEYKMNLLFSVAKIWSDLLLKS